MDEVFKYQGFSILKLYLIVLVVVLAPTFPLTSKM